MAGVAVLGVAATAAAPAGDATLEQVLQQLDQVGKNLREFSAKVSLTETDNTLGTSAIREGQAFFQKRPDGTARVHVLFTVRIDPERHRAYPNDRTEYLLDGPWLIDRNYRTKSEVKRQVLRPGQKMDLFKLGEGPFPLPIGQDPAEVHKAFDVQKVAAAKDDPPNTVHLRLAPRADTDLARKFHVIDVWVDNKNHMPVRVDTLDSKQQTTRSTQLSDIVVNPPRGLPDSDFQLPNIEHEHWQRSVE